MNAQKKAEAEAVRNIVMGIVALVFAGFTIFNVLFPKHDGKKAAPPPAEIATTETTTPASSSSSDTSVTDYSREKISSIATSAVDDCYSSLKSSADASSSMNGDQAMRSLSSVLDKCGEDYRRLKSSLPDDSNQPNQEFLAAVREECSDNILSVISSGRMRFSGAGGGVGVLNTTDYADLTHGMTASTQDPHLCVGVVEEAEQAPHS